jgi:hypothetical protein
MAFKTLDFSKLDRAPRKPQSPYQYTDDMHFARTFKGMKPHSGKVTVGLEQHRLTMGLDDLRVPAEKAGTYFDLILMGERARDWDEIVHNSLFDERAAILEAVEDLREADWEVADGVTAEVEVEGYWKKRWFKDRHDNWQHVMELHVARFNLDGVEKGRLPDMGA